MTIEKIRKMSDEEFINYVRSFKENNQNLKYNSKLTKKIIDFGGIFSGMTFGCLASRAVDCFANNEVTLEITFIIGSLVAIPVSRKFVKWLYVKFFELNDYNDKQNLIELKKDIEKLNNEEIILLKAINNNSNMYELHNKITYIINDKNSNKFIDSLKVTYEDDDKDLGYSKNIIKNN